jgi:hypothetical protein
VGFDQLIDGIQKLAQLGLPSLLLAGIIIEGLALRYVFKLYVASADRITAALVSNSETLRTLTDQVQASGKLAEANRGQLEAVSRSIDALALAMRR